MSDTPKVLEVCCCGNCAAAGHDREVYRDMTPAEIAQRDQDAAAAAEAEAARLAEAEEAAAALLQARQELLDAGISEASVDAIMASRQ